MITDHKPLTFALATPHQICRLDFIAKFNPDICFFKGSSNAAADGLSRGEVDSVHTSSDVAMLIDFAAMTHTQQDDPYLSNLMDSSLQLYMVPLPTAAVALLCDMT